MIDESEDPVAVHVRRGDYKALQNLFVIFCEEYYENAFDFIESKISDPNNFVFSDEIDFVQKNLLFKRKVHYVRTDSAIKDFELSGMCHHSINSNSTFSWWTAYVKNNKDKIVIMPRKYFAKKEWQDGYEKEPGNGYMPSSWMKA